MRRIAPLILGGGPAGAAAAITLARGGAKPLILERARETGDAICGGFVSWRTLASLDQLGLTDEAIAGHKITALRLFAGKNQCEAPLPHRAMGVSRRHLDSLLLARAQAEGAGLERGVTIREIGDGGTIRLSDDSAIDAESIFLATGKHDVRGIIRPRSGDSEAQTLGLRMMLRPSAALTALIGPSIELHMFDGGYCGILLNESGHANLCLAVRKSRLSAAGGQPRALLAQLAHENPAFGDRLAFMTDSETIDAIAAIPYGWRARDTAPGLFKLGDQAAVIPSLAGEGNGIALASGMMAGSAWLAGGLAASTRYQTHFAKRAARPVTLASWLWHRGEMPVTAKLATHILRAFPALAGHLAELTRIRD
jgi:menaquinone-9 beta-reductase